MTETGNMTYLTKTASEQDIFSHLRLCDASFVPALSTRVNLADYSKKIAEHAITFEAWHNHVLAGMIAAYFNGSDRRAFITSVSVLNEYKEQGIASALLRQCKQYAREHHYPEIRLEVNRNNTSAVKFYTKYDFTQTDLKDDVWTMSFQVNQHQ